MGSGGIAPFILQPGQLHASFALPLGNKPQCPLKWKLDGAPEPVRISCQNLEWAPVLARMQEKRKILSPY
jgi:hypothetical protein